MQITKKCSLIPWRIKATYYRCIF